MAIWHNAPFVRILFGLIVGIILANLLTTWLYTAVIVLSFSLLLLTLTLIFRHRYFVGWTGLFVLASTIAVGYLVVGLSSSKEHPPVPDSAVVIEGVVLDYPGQTSSGRKVPVEVKTVLKEGEIHGFQHKILLYYNPEQIEEELRPGDHLVIDVRMSAPGFPLNPGSFDYGAYLRSKGFVATAFPTGRYVKTDPNSCNGIKCLALRSRNFMERTIDRHVEVPEDRALIKALALGDRMELSGDHKDAFAKAGAMHILAVSGLHVGIVWLILGKLLGMFNRIKAPPWWKVMVVILVIWLYATITGLSASVCRAATMFTFIVFGMGLNRKQHIYNSIAASAFILLMIDPRLLYDVGFQLSYCAVIGIVVIYPRVYHSVYIQNTYLDKIWALICVSIAAQISTLPLVLFYFGRFPTWFLLTNLVAIPVAFGVLSSALLLIVVDLIGLGEKIVAFVLNLCTRALNSSIEWISHLPFATMNNIWIDWIDLVLLSILIVAGVNRFLYRRKPWIWVVLGCILLILVNDHSYIQRRNNQQVLIIPYLKNRTAVTIVEGRHAKHYVYNKSPLDAFYTAGLDEVFGIEEHEMSRLQDSAGNVIRVDVQDGTLWVISQPIEDSLICAHRPKKVVISGALNWYEARDIQDACEHCGIGFHDCSEAGAWVSTFENNPLTD